MTNMATITLEYNPRNRAVQKVLEAWIEEGIVQQLPTKSKDDSCMGRKEFYAAIDVAKAQARRGESKEYSMDEIKDLLGV